MALWLVTLVAGCIDFYSRIPCDATSECPDGYVCGADEGGSFGVCVDASGAGICPDDAVVVVAGVSLDAYEASRADATEGTAGSDDSIACSQVGVVPWAPAEYGDAEVACAAAGKRLCTSDELNAACRSGGEEYKYPYGLDYVVGNCNDAEAEYGEVALTGSFPKCVESTGAVFDLVGNLAEAIGDSWGYSAGGGWKASGETSAICGYRNNFANSGGDPSGFRCCM